MAKFEYNPKLEKGDRIVCIEMDDYHSSIPMGMKGTVDRVDTPFIDEIIYGVNWDNGSKLNLVERYEIYCVEENNKLSEMDNYENKIFVTKSKIKEYEDSKKYKIGIISVDPYLVNNLKLDVKSFLKKNKQYLDSGFVFENDGQTFLPIFYDRWIKEGEVIKRKRTDESIVLVTNKKNILIESEKNFYEQNKDLFKYFNHKMLHQFLKNLRESSITNMLGATQYLYMGREMIAHLHHYEDFDDNNKRSEAYEKVLEMADDVRNEMISGSMKLLKSQNKEIDVRPVEKLVQEYARKMLIAYTKFAGGYLNT